MASHSYKKIPTINMAVKILITITVALIFTDVTGYPRPQNEENNIESIKTEAVDNKSEQSSQPPNQQPTYMQPLQPLYINFSDHQHLPPRSFFQPNIFPMLPFHQPILFPPPFPQTSFAFQQSESNQQTTKPDEQTNINKNSFPVFVFQEPSPQNATQANHPQFLLTNPQINPSRTTIIQPAVFQQPNALNITQQQPTYPQLLLLNPQENGSTVAIIQPGIPEQPSNQRNVVVTFSVTG